MKSDEITISILRYLLDHPEAGDSLEGIVHWWILRERIETKTKEVSDVIQALTSEGFVIEKSSISGKRYFVNKEKLEEIRTLIQGSK